jgi:putative transposase
VHSDWRSQYCSAACQKLIRAHELRCGMSAKGNCYDNACAERFLHSLKVESVHGERFRTRDRMRATVFESIETDYNRQWRHSTLGYISPEAFEARPSDLAQRVRKQGKITWPFSGDLCKRPMCLAPWRTLWLESCSGGGLNPFDHGPQAIAASDAEVLDQIQLLEILLDIEIADVSRMLAVIGGQYHGQ